MKIRVGLLVSRSLVLWLLAIGAALILASCAKAPEEAGIDSCTVKEDCVADSCCHAAALVNKEHAPDCKGIVCSMVCSGPLDCGAGNIECINGKCSIGDD